MKVKRTELRLVPCDASKYFKEHREDYVRLCAGEVVVVPDAEAAELLSAFGATVCKVESEESTVKEKVAGTKKTAQE